MSCDLIGVLSVSRVDCFGTRSVSFSYASAKNQLTGEQGIGCMARFEVGKTSLRYWCVERRQANRFFEPAGETC